MMGPRFSKSFISLFTFGDNFRHCFDEKSTESISEGHHDIHPNDVQPDATQHNDISVMTFSSIKHGTLRIITLSN
jgi:hypothetical protein